MIAEEQEDKEDAMIDIQDVQIKHSGRKIGHYYYFLINFFKLFRHCYCL
jgi:hypothetical protein